MPAVFREDFGGIPDLPGSTGAGFGGYMQRADLRDPSGFSWVDAAGQPVKGIPEGMTGVPNPYGGGAGSVGASGLGTRSVATGGMVGGTGPYKYDAQLQQINSEFADIMKRGLSGLNEQAAISGGFAGGIPYDKKQEFITKTGQAQGSAIERLMNDIMGRNMAWEMEERRSRGGGEGERFGDANENQQIMEMMGQSGPTGARFGGNTRSGGSSGGDVFQTGSPSGGSSGPSVNPSTGEPIRGKNETFSAFNARWQSWFRNKKGATQPAAGQSGWSTPAPGAAGPSGPFTQYPG